MPLLHVERHGRILDQEVRDILGFLEECYGRLRPVGLDLVEIVLFENDRLWRSHMANEVHQLVNTGNEPLEFLCVKGADERYAS